MNTLVKALKVQGFIFAFFIGLPPLLRAPLGYYSLTQGDLLDLFTPLVLVPVYVYIFVKLTASLEKRRFLLGLIFTGAIVFWVEGHGMHLAANSLDNLFALRQGGLEPAVVFFDEVLSHLFWHVGQLAVMVMFSYLGLKNRQLGFIPDWIFLSSAALSGFVAAMASIEGQTVNYVLPVVLGLLAWGARRRFKGDRLQDFPAFLYFSVHSLVGVGIFVLWGILYGGFPEPSKMWSW
jgi:hypothetical protein